MEKTPCKSMPMEYLKQRMLAKGFVPTSRSKKKICSELSTIKRIKKAAKLDACMCLDKPEIEAYGNQFGITLKGSKKKMCNDYYNLDKTLKKVKEQQKDPQRAPSMNTVLTNIDKAIVMLQERSKPITHVRWFLQGNGIPVTGARADVIIHKLVVLKKIIHKAKEDKFTYRDLFEDSKKIMQMPYTEAVKFIYGTKQSGVLATLSKLGEPKPAASGAASASATSTGAAAYAAGAASTSTGAGWKTPSERAPPTGPGAGTDDDE